MKKMIWKIGILADGILAFIFVSSFDVDELVLPYVGALICIALFLLMLAAGWNYIMDDVKKDELEMWEFMDERDR